MMKKNNKPIRIIPLLDIKNGVLVKGINLEGLRVLGIPEKFAKYYYQTGADEIIYIDNVATLYGTNNLSEFISKTAKHVFIPLAVGGGIKSLNDIKEMFKAGADKVCINSSIIDNVKNLEKAAKVYGSSNISVIIQAIKIQGKYYISKSNGRDLINKNPKDWAKKVEDYGAGEIIITSINNEGLKNGFDIKLTQNISNSVKIPVIAHGGAGNFKDVLRIIKQTKISGVAVASLFHYEAINNFSKPNPKIGNTNFINNYQIKKSKNIIKDLKEYLIKKGIEIRT
jgi:imidazole glycerol-phosphate synthase subunit HisF